MMSFGFLLAFCNPGNCTHFLVFRLRASNRCKCLPFQLLVQLICLHVISSRRQLLVRSGVCNFLHNVSKTSTLFLLLFCTRQQGWGKGWHPLPPSPSDNYPFTSIIQCKYLSGVIKNHYSSRFILLTNWQTVQHSFPLYEMFLISS